MLWVAVAVAKNIHPKDDIRVCGPLTYNVYIRAIESPHVQEHIYSYYHTTIYSGISQSCNLITCRQLDKGNKGEE